MDEIFDSSVRSAGDFGGVFEFDGDTSYFYLYRISGDEGSRVVDAIKIGVGAPSFSQADVKIFWSLDESLVCLQIADTLVAIFDCIDGSKYGEIYARDWRVKMPSSVADRLSEH